MIMDTKFLSIAAVLLVLFTLEGVIPYMQGRTQRLKHAIPHVLVAIGNGALTKLALSAMTMQAISVAEGHSFGLMRMIALPATLRGIVVFILFDIWMYYWHMANHHIGFLWLFHRAHHADIEMDTTTALRFHPGELVLSTFIRLPVIMLIGMSFPELVLFEVMLNSSTLFHHSNVALPKTWDRMLRILIVTPDMHRVHHSVDLEEMNSNFTSLLSFWDRLGHTFRMRSDTRSIRFGLPFFREAKYQRLTGFLITPFR
jgi:sterol desaturase/sphingolipid hydroxylase (fatty acid hydroxylase superfamily)